MKKIKRVGILALAFVFCFIFSSQVVTASDFSENVSNDSSTLIPIEETEFTREEAIEILGVSDEDAEKMSFYVVDAEAATISDSESGISPQGIGIEGIYHFPTFTFSGKNVGAYWTCKGTKLTWAAVHHSSANHNNTIAIFLYGYGRENPDDVFDGCTDCVVSLKAGDSYRMGHYISSPMNYDYHFVYYGGDQSTVTMIVGVL